MRTEDTPPPPLLLHSFLYYLLPPSLIPYYSILHFLDPSLLSFSNLSSLFLFFFYLVYPSLIFLPLFPLFFLPPIRPPISLPLSFSPWSSSGWLNCGVAAGWGSVLSLQRVGGEARTRQYINADPTVKEPSFKALVKNPPAFSHHKVIEFSLTCMCVDVQYLCVCVCASHCWRPCQNSNWFSFCLSPQCLSLSTPLTLQLHVRPDLYRTLDVFMYLYRSQLFLLISDFFYVLLKSRCDYVTLCPRLPDYKDVIWSDDPPPPPSPARWPDDDEFWLKLIIYHLPISSENLTVPSSHTLLWSGALLSATKMTAQKKSPSLFTLTQIYHWVWL